METEGHQVIPRRVLGGGKDRDKSASAEPVGGLTVNPDRDDPFNRKNKKDNGGDKQLLDAKGEENTGQWLNPGGHQSPFRRG